MGSFLYSLAIILLKKREKAVFFYLIVMWLSVFFVSVARCLGLVFGSSVIVAFPFFILVEI